MDELNSKHWPYFRELRKKGIIYLWSESLVKTYSVIQSRIPDHVIVEDMREPADQVASSHTHLGFATPPIACVRLATGVCF